MRSGTTAQFLLLAGMILSVASPTGEACAQQVSAQLDSSSDFFCYYGYFDENTVQQCRYFDLLILDIGGITAQQVQEIRSGFDGMLGTEDDVLVIGYLSVGEAHRGDVVGNGKGPVYRKGSTVIYQNKGYASFYLDDRDTNGVPDKDPIWNSYYVNAGDSTWWEYNSGTVERILTRYGCDGLFLDLIDIAGPNTWGLPYEWTADGMVRYLEYLRNSHPGKYILANRGIFFFDPSLPHHQYANRYRAVIDGLMIESFFAAWDWTRSVGYRSPDYQIFKQYFAPLVGAEAKKADGFNVFILDYLAMGQSDYAALLDSVVIVTERDRGWLVAVSSVSLNAIRYDTYHHHLVDNNPPTWNTTVGAAACRWLGDTLEVSCSGAFDQTPPVKYHIYVSDSTVDFSLPARYSDVTPQVVSGSGCTFHLLGLDPRRTYQVAVRASDGASLSHMDQNRKTLTINPSGTNAVSGDLQFFPQNLSLVHGEYPNPFNASVTFEGQFNRPPRTAVTITIFDLMGRVVDRETVAAAGAPGYRWSWPASRPGAGTVASGVYIFRIQAEGRGALGSGKVIHMK